MDAISTPGVEEVVVMKSGRIGFTSVLENAIGYHMEYDPCPMLMVQPTVEDAQEWSKDQLTPLLRDTPCLQGRVQDVRGKNSENTILHKKFPGGYIKVIGANSPRGFRRITVRLLLFDELDAAPPSAGSEGAPFHLALRRTATVWNRKIVVGSTPTIRDLSAIEMEYANSSQGHFYVPCPKCAQMQVLVFSPTSLFAKPTNGRLIGGLSKGYLKFDKENCTWATYVCEGCAAELSEPDKYAMIRGGEWRHVNSSVTATVGFHLNELYSTFNSTWLSLAQAFLIAKQTRETLQVFVNTRLGETFEDEQAYTISDHALISRVENYETAPAGVLLITGAIDVQGDRLEAAAWGWGKGDESWLIDHQVFYGEPTGRQVWERADQWVQRRYRHESGVELPIRCVFVDSGYNAADVYRFTAARQKAGVYASKGYSGRRVLIDRPIRDKRTRALVFKLGVDDGKAKIYDRLRIENPGPGYTHFNKLATPDFFRQLTSERLVTKWSKGYPTRIWELPAGRRNEALDLAVMALCAKEFLNPAWELLEKRIAARAGGEKPTEHEEVDLPRVTTVRRPRRGFGWNVHG